MPDWEVVAELSAQVGEGPLWDPGAQVLWAVDIPAQALHRLDVASGRASRFDVGLMVGALALRRSGGLVLAAQGGFYTWDERAQAPVLLAAVDAGDVTRRLNDGGCDDAGRFWAGAMDVAAAPGAGILWSLEVDRSVRSRLPDLTIPNGVDWSDDGRTMYFVDSATHRIDALQVAADGGLGDRRSWASLPADVLPDGLTVDAEGGVWVALWGGSAVHHYGPMGELLERHELPVTQVTSCAFGGADLTDLYVTTAAAGLSPADLADQPLAGAVFRFAGVGRGRPPRTYGG